MPKKNSDENEVRVKNVHIAFTPLEKEDIKKHAKESNMTISEFIRQAVFDKMMRIDNPELYANQSQSLDDSRFNEILKEIRTTNQEQKKVIEQLSIMHEIQETLRVFGEQIHSPKKEENEKIVITLLKEHGKLKPFKIMQLSGLTNEEVYNTISSSKLFSINMNGDVELK